MYKQWMPYYTQPPVRTKTACKIHKLKCKAGLSTTLMKSRIKPSRESMCTGGNESEAKQTGSSASYLAPPLPSPSPLSLPCLSLPTPFPPISLPVAPPCPPSFSFNGYLYNLSLLAIGLLPFPSLNLSFSPSLSPPSLLPSGCFLPSLSLSVGATSGSFSAADEARLDGGESEIIGLIPPSSQRLSRYSITP